MRLVLRRILTLSMEWKTDENGGDDKLVFLSWMQRYVGRYGLQVIEDVCGEECAIRTGGCTV
jgi:hypothetical protein